MPLRSTARVPSPEWLQTRKSVAFGYASGPSLSRVLSKYEAHPSDGMKQLALEWIVQFPSEAGDMHINDVVDWRGAPRLLPHIAGKHLARDNGPLASNQIFQQVVFSGREINQRAASGHRTGGHIDREIAEREGRRALRATTAH